MTQVINTSVPIVIFQSTPSLTGFTPFSQHGALGIARTAGRLGIRVYLVHGHTSSPAASSRYVYETYLNTRPPSDDLVDFLLDCGRRIGREAILIPIDDIAAVFVADRADDLRERFIFPDQPSELARTLSSKREMHFLCKELGVPTPEATFPQSATDVATFAESALFPVVMKSIAGWLPDHHSQMSSVTIVNSPMELIEEYTKSGAQGEPNVMLQEYIPGGPEDVWMFNGYFTDQSECLVSFTGKKIRQAPPFTGATTLGICLKNESVEELATDFLQNIGYSGIVDMGYRYDRRDGQYKLLDVNPRVGTTFRLFADSHEMDVVRALYLDLTGQPVRRGSFREGRKWIVEPADLMSSLRYARLGRLTAAEWALSLRGIEEAAWFSLDDPWPFAAMCLASLVKGGRKASKRVRAARVVQAT